MKKMFLRIFGVNKEHTFAIIICFILFIIPFFWLNPGEMDIGGDANRLYFYDPVSFLQATALYDIAKEGRGSVEPRYFYFPYVFTIVILKSFLSSTIIINFFNSLKLSIGFLSIYLIVFELLSRSGKIKDKRTVITSAILSGIFYTVSFASFHMAFFWDRALFTHDQIFLNPLIFYFILQFFLKDNYKYLWTALLISFMYSTNFSLLGSAPPLFAFYPLALLFLCLYVTLFSDKKISWKKISIAIIGFLGVHAFHLFAEILSFFDKGSSSNSLVFSKANIEAEGVGYFTAVHYYGQAILNLLLPSENKYLMWTSLFSPVIILIGFLLNKKKKDFLLIALFFIVTFFLATANITHIGFLFYKQLFYIPGFAMFRNFYTQWMYIFIFFYTLLLGFSLCTIATRLKAYYRNLFFWFIFSIFIITGIPLILGWPVNNVIIRGSNHVRTVSQMDPRYEETLRFIRQLPDDGKIMTLPLTDFFRQVISGKNGGAYEGPSTLLDLTDKYSFSGYQHFGYKNNTPYAEDILRYAREKKYDRILNIFSVLNIRYILYDSDSKVYESGFSPGPYGYMQTSLPKTQAEYKEFLKHFPLHVMYQNGPFIVYSLDTAVSNATIFIPDGIYQSNALVYDKNGTHKVFIGKNICESKELHNICETYKKPQVKITYRMINPTLYKVSITQQKKPANIVLVLQQTFHTGWKLVINKKPIAEKKHMQVNGYANGWLLTGDDIPKENTYTLFIEQDLQKYFMIGWLITGLFLIMLAWFLIKSGHFKNEKI